MSERIVDDGFGNAWVMCPHPKCDLQIVRPGKVQCSGYSNCNGDDYVLDIIEQATRVEPCR